MFGNSFKLNMAMKKAPCAPCSAFGLFVIVACFAVMPKDFTQIVAVSIGVISYALLMLLQPHAEKLPVNNKKMELKLAEDPESPHASPNKKKCNVAKAKGVVDTQTATNAKPTDVPPKSTDASDDSPVSRNAKSRRRRKHSTAIVSHCQEPEADDLIIVSMPVIAHEHSTISPATTAAIEAADGAFECGLEEAQHEEEQGQWEQIVGKKRKSKKKQGVTVALGSAIVDHVPVLANEEDCSNEVNDIFPKKPENEPNPLHPEQVNASIPCSSEYCVEPYPTIFCQAEELQIPFSPYLVELPSPLGPLTNYEGSFGACQQMPGNEIIWMEPMGAQNPLVDSFSYGGDIMCEPQCFSVCASFDGSDQMILPLMAPPDLTMMPIMPSPPPPTEQNDWDSCWDWIQRGCCKRGATCRWKHPPLMCESDFDQSWSSIGFS